MDTTTTLLQHPLHDKQHPLELQDFTNDSIHPLCDLCSWEISADGYACEECKFYAHRVCAKAPPRIDLHPLHTDHPLTLTHCPPPFIDNVCDLCDSSHDSLFRCNQCDFHLDIRCALYTLSDWEGSNGKSPEQIMLPLHPHTLTSFSTRHDFIGDSNCVICKASVEGDEDSYACLNYRCDFLIHKRCVQDLYYRNGTKAPQVYHRHTLETFLGEDTRLTDCEKCASDKSSGEFIGCAECKVFYCRDCVQVPESIQYPHHPDHTLVLFFNSLDNDRSQCDSCLVDLEDELCYGCTSCEFFAHVGCALQVLSYCEEGMSTEIKLSWHEHQLHLCHRNKSDWRHCSYCEDKSAGPMYTCKEKGCKILLHKRCTEIETTIIHPHHPDHNLVLLINFPDNDNPQCDSCSVLLKGELCYGCTSCKFFAHVGCALQVLSYCEEGMSAEIKLSWHKHPLLLGHKKKYDSDYCSYCVDISAGPMYVCKVEDCKLLLHKRCTEIESTIINRHHPDHPLTLGNRADLQMCGACSENNHYLKFSCELCAFYLHIKCAARFPTRKHYLHEHELLRLDKAPFWECNRCGTSTNASLFRCVPCDFNLHEACMELPRIVESEIHWHSLTLHEFYVEDDSGEYYCDQCEKRRDVQLGAYVCLQCSLRWAYHIECVIPELRKVCVKEHNAAEIERLARDITKRKEEVREAERKLEEMKREMDEQTKK